MSAVPVPWAASATDRVPVPGSSAGVAARSWSVTTPTRLRSRRPSTQATNSTHTALTIIGRIIGTNTWPTSTPSALAVRAVGPPQGRMLKTPPASMMTHASTSRLMPSRL